MEAATKNKRGRPRKHQIIETLFPEYEPRRAQNMYYAMGAIKEIAGGRSDNFFVTPKGKIKRQGIAEQLGRIYAEGIASPEECRALLETVKQEYAAGASVKDLERKLRRTRLALTKERET